ncbi:hypothetical protein M601_014175 [Cellulophaga baltica 4]|nr:hypothetical protein M601_014175 [Cellulophaga baltica 4]
MEPHKIALLDNYQLYQLLQNHAIDTSTLAALKKNMPCVNYRGMNKSDWHKKYAVAHTDVNAALEKKPWSPILTGFAYNKHFRYIAFLKVHGRTQEAKQHLLELYLGLALYFLAFIAFLLLFRTL